jgi:F1F0 ATPase subunit 2
VAGALLGLLYFGGLWLSVRLFLRQPRRTAWLATSHAARFATLGLGLTVLSRGGAGPLLAALLGLWLARTFLVCRLGGLHHES